MRFSVPFSRAAARPATILPGEWQWNGAQVGGVRALFSVSGWMIVVCEKGGDCVLYWEEG